MKNAYSIEEKEDGYIRVIEPSVRDAFFTQMENLNYTYATIQTYKYPLNRFLLFLTEQGIERIQEVTLETIEKYRLILTREKFKSASLEVYLRTVKLLFKYLESSGEVFANIANKIVIPRPEFPLLSPWSPVKTVLDKYSLQGGN
jgi:site-specific recombinase XerD